MRRIRLLLLLLLIGGVARAMPAQLRAGVTVALDSTGRQPSIRLTHLFDEREWREAVNDGVAVRVAWNVVLWRKGGVAFLHTRAKDKGKIARPFMIVGRSWEGIPFGAADGNPTYLFFLLGLKYDKLHLPILGRLARSLRNPATIAKLRSLSSPDQVRALLLKEDAQVRAGLMPEFEGETNVKPKLDRTLRLRAIRRLQAAKAPAPPEKPKKPRTKKK